MSKVGSAVIGMVALPPFVMVALLAALARVPSHTWLATRSVAATMAAVSRLPALRVFISCLTRPTLSLHKNRKGIGTGDRRNDSRLAVPGLLQDAHDIAAQHLGNVATAVAV